MSRISVLLILELIVASSIAAAATSPLPNVVLLYADDLGYGDVGCYGATRVRTPNIDRLAKESLRFTDAHSASATCTPSRYAMLTGEYAWRKRGTGVLPGDAPLIIEPGRATVASILHDAGYKTGIIGKWHLGLGNGSLDWNGEIKPGPLELGFDYCFLMPATGDRVPCVYVENHHVVGLDPRHPMKVSFKEHVGDEPTGKDHPELLALQPSHGHDQTIVNGVSRIGYMSGGESARWADEDMADTYVKKATAFIDEHQSERFFLYFSTHDIHVPRMPHPRFAGQTDLGRRGDVIVQFDWCVGQVLAALERHGLVENTLVILTSDNGPVVDDGYRDGAKERLGDHSPAGPFRGGKYSIFEGGTRVPFLVRWRGRVKPGTSDALICQVDFAATFAALVEKGFNSKTSPDSENVLAALLADSNDGRRRLVEHSGGIALREASWKLIPKHAGAKRLANTNTETGNDPDVQLYDLSGDPGEQKNVAAMHADRVKEMTAALAAERAKASDALPPAAVTK